MLRVRFTFGEGLGDVCKVHSVARRREEGQPEREAIEDEK
jgi:hypothetical protein